MRSLSSVLTVAKNAWDQPSPWLWLLEIEYDDWWMIEYEHSSGIFQDGAIVTTSGGASGTIVINIATEAIGGLPSAGILIVSDTSGGSFVARQLIFDDAGGTAVIRRTVNTSTADPIIARFVRNTENIYYTYENTHYYAFPFNIGIASTAKNQFRSLDIIFSNALRLVEAFIRRGNGLLGARVTVKIVWAGDLTAEPAWEEQYELKKTTVKHDTVTVTCGQDNFLMRGFPRYRYSRKRCRWRFKSDSCGYTGASTSCNRMLDGCIASSNTSRFGGFPGIPGSFFSA